MRDLTSVNTIDAVRGNEVSLMMLLICDRNATTYRMAQHDAT
jgi:hypothetical protein